MSWLVRNWRLTVSIAVLLVAGSFAAGLYSVGAAEAASLSTQVAALMAWLGQKWVLRMQVILYTWY